MRNTLVLITLFCFTQLAVYSQYTFTPETNLGLKIGGTTSRVGFDPKIDQDLKFGFIGGLVFKHISQKGLGIQLEVNYLQVGWSEDLDSINIYSRRLDYIQVPFMTHACIGEGNVRFVLNAGPYLSFLVSDYERIDLLPAEEENIYYREDIEIPLEFGLCLGLGLAINTSIGIFQVEGRANLSLNNIFEENDATPFIVSQNQFAELTLSYLIDFRKIRGKKSSR